MQYVIKVNRSLTAIIVPDTSFWKEGCGVKNKWTEAKLYNYDFKI